MDPIISSILMLIVGKLFDSYFARSKKYPKYIGSVAYLKNKLKKKEVIKMENVKPGWKSTEFWFVGILPQVLAILVATGVISPDQQVLVQDGLETIVEQGSGLWASIMSLGGALGYGVARGLAKFNKK